MSGSEFLTREQQYAQLVYKRIAPLIKEDEAKRKAYGSLAHTLPVLIRTAGLVQALVFVQARNKEEKDKPKPQRQLIRDLEAVLREAKVLTQGNLVERSRTAPFEEYMRLTEGALQALLWFKRFAQSELDVVAPTDDAGDDYA